MHEMEILFNNLPQAITDHLRRHFGSRLPDLCELYLQLGHVPEAIFADPCTGATCREEISNLPCSDSDIGMFSAFFGADEETSVTMTKRRGITGTLHRVSLITHPMKVPEKVLVSVKLFVHYTLMMNKVSFLTHCFATAQLPNHQGDCVSCWKGYGGIG